MKDSATTSTSGERTAGAGDPRHEVGTHDPDTSASRLMPPVSASTNLTGLNPELTLTREMREQGEIQATFADVGIRGALGPTVLSISGLLSGERRTAGKRPYRVLSGPLAGSVITCPDGERPSMALGTYEPHVSSAIRNGVREGDCVIDIGAHVGYLALVASRIVGPGGRVIAAEASPRNAQLLRENVARNNAGNLTVMECAVADEVGIVTFASFDTYSTVGHIQNSEEPDDASLTSVPLTTIDHIVLKDEACEPRLIKIDVEGAEFRVIRGATQVLERYSPTVIVEARRRSTLEPIRSLLNSMHYEGIELHSSVAIADGEVVDMAFTKRSAYS